MWPVTRLLAGLPFLLSLNYWIPHFKEKESKRLDPVVNKEKERK